MSLWEEITEGKTKRRVFLLHFHSENTWFILEGFLSFPCQAFAQEVFLQAVRTFHCFKFYNNLYD